MATYLLFDDRRLEVLDKTIIFMEGDKLHIEKKPYAILNIAKVVRTSDGKTCDVDTEIHLG